MTGKIGDCEIGEEEAAEAKKQIPNEIATLEELVYADPDDNGCCRPVMAFPNPRYGNSGGGEYAVLTPDNQAAFPFPAFYSVAIFVQEKPKAQLTDLLKTRAKEFAAREGIIIEGFRFLEQYTNYKEQPL